MGALCCQGIGKYRDYDAVINVNELTIGDDCPFHRQRCEMYNEPVVGSGTEAQSNYWWLSTPQTHV